MLGGNKSNWPLQIFILSSLVLFLSISGCSFYPSIMPQESGDINDSDLLKGPANEELFIKANKIHHPLLKPLSINFSDGISPDEAAVIAVIANPLLKSERDRKKIARAQVIQAGLLPNPQLSLSLEFPTAGATHDTFTAYGLGLDWDVSSLITRGARLSSAKWNQEAVNLEVAWKEWLTAERARLHWLRLYWSLEKKKLLKKWSLISQKRVKLLEEAVKRGIETAPTLSSAQTVLANVKAQAAKNREDIQGQLAILKRVMGLPPDYELALQKLDFKVPFTQKVKKQIEEATKNFLDRRLDVLALKAACKARNEEVKAAILSKFPRIGIGILHARDTGNVITTGPSLSIEVPIFDRKQGQLARAKAQGIKARDEYLARIFEARSKAAEIKERIRCLIEYHSRLVESVRAQGKMLNIYGKAMENGITDAMAYYQALDSFLIQRIELLKVKEGITGLIVALEMATGTHINLNKKKQLTMKNKADTWPRNGGIQMTTPYRNRYRTVFFILMSFLLIAFFWPCKVRASGAKEVETVSSLVQTVKVQKRILTRELIAYGRIIPAPGSTRSLAMPFESVIRRVFVTEGQQIKKCEPLFQLSPSPSTLLMVQSAKSSLEAARLELEKVKERVRLKLATSGELIQAEKNYKKALLQVKNLERMKICDKITINAPNNGMITRLYCKVGQIMPAGAPLMEVSDENAIQAVVGIEPEDAHLLTAGQTVYLSPINRKISEKLKGQIDTASQWVNPASRLVDAFVQIMPKAHLFINEFVRARIILQKKEGMVVPRSAVLPSYKSPVCFTVRGNRAHRHLVKTGWEGKNYVEIISSSIRPGDDIVIRGNYELRDGMTVRVTSQGLQSPAMDTSNLEQS